jgi:hypothetical protein
MFAASVADAGPEASRHLRSTRVREDAPGSADEEPAEFPATACPGSTTTVGGPPRPPPHSPKSSGARPDLVPAERSIRPKSYEKASGQSGIVRQSRAEKVEFAAFAFAGVLPDSPFLLDVWAYLPNYSAAGKGIAKKSGPGTSGEKSRGVRSEAVCVSTRDTC